MVRHIPGVENGAADALSRDDLPSFQHLVLYAAREPSRLPEQLIQCMVHGTLPMASSIRSQKLTWQEPSIYTLKRSLTTFSYPHCANCAMSFWRSGSPMLYRVIAVGSAFQSLPLLRAIKGHWKNNVLIRTWSCCGRPAAWPSFRFVWAGELTVPSDQASDLAVHLSLCNISIDNPADPGVLRVRLKALKTNPLQKGISLYIRKVASDICPVSAMLAYLLVRGRQAGPLFKYQDVWPLTHHRLVAAVCDALR